MAARFSDLTVTKRSGFGTLEQAGGASLAAAFQRLEDALYDAPQAGNGIASPSKAAWGQAPALPCAPRPDKASAVASALLALGAQPLRPEGSPPLHAAKASSLGPGPGHGQQQQAGPHPTPPPSHHSRRGSSAPATGSGSRSSRQGNRGWGRDASTAWSLGPSSWGGGAGGWDSQGSGEDAESEGRRSLRARGRQRMASDRQTHRSVQQQSMEWGVVAPHLRVRGGRCAHCRQQQQGWQQQQQQQQGRQPQVAGTKPGLGSHVSITPGLTELMQVLHGKEDMHASSHASHHASGHASEQLRSTHSASSQPSEPDDVMGLLVSSGPRGNADRIPQPVVVSKQVPAHRPPSILLHPSDSSQAAARQLLGVMPSIQCDTGIHQGSMQAGESAAGEGGGPGRGQRLKLGHPDACSRRVSYRNLSVMMGGVSVTCKEGEGSDRDMSLQLEGVQYWPPPSKLPTEQVGCRTGIQARPPGVKQQQQQQQHGAGQQQQQQQQLGGPSLALQPGTDAQGQGLEVVGRAWLPAPHTLSSSSTGSTGAEGSTGGTDGSTHGTRAATGPGSSLGTGTHPLLCLLPHPPPCSQQRLPDQAAGPGGHTLATASVMRPSESGAGGGEEEVIAQHGPPPQEVLAVQWDIWEQQQGADPHAAAPNPSAASQAVPTAAGQRAGRMAAAAGVGGWVADVGAAGGPMQGAHSPDPVVGGSISGSASGEPSQGSSVGAGVGVGGGGVGVGVGCGALQGGGEVWRRVEGLRDSRALEVGLPAVEPLLSLREQAVEQALQQLWHCLVPHLAPLVARRLAARRAARTAALALTSPNVASSFTQPRQGQQSGSGSRSRAASGDSSSRACAWTERGGGAGSGGTSSVASEMSGASSAQRPTAFQQHLERKAAAAVDRIAVLRQALAAPSDAMASAAAEPGPPPAQAADGRQLLHTGPAAIPPLGPGVLTAQGYQPLNPTTSSADADNDDVRLAHLLSTALPAAAALARNGRLNRGLPSAATATAAATARAAAAAAAAKLAAQQDVGLQGALPGRLSEWQERLDSKTASDGAGTQWQQWQQQGSTTAGAAAAAAAGPLASIASGTGQRQGYSLWPTAAPPAKAAASQFPSHLTQPHATILRSEPLSGPLHPRPSRTSSLPHPLPLPPPAAPPPPPPPSTNTLILLPPGGLPPLRVAAAAATQGEAGPIGLSEQQAGQQVQRRHPGQQLHQVALPSHPHPPGGERVAKSQWQQQHHHHQHHQQQQEQQQQQQQWSAIPTGGSLPSCTASGSSWPQAPAAGGHTVRMGMGQLVHPGAYKELTQAMQASVPSCTTGPNPPRMWANAQVGISVAENRSRVRGQAGHSALGSVLTCGSATTPAGNGQPATMVSRLIPKTAPPAVSYARMVSGAQVALPLVARPVAQESQLLLSLAVGRNISVLSKVAKGAPRAPRGEVAVRLKLPGIASQDRNAHGDERSEKKGRK